MIVFPLAPLVVVKLFQLYPYLQDFLTSTALVLGYLEYCMQEVDLNVIWGVFIKLPNKFDNLAWLMQTISGNNSSSLSYTKH